MGLDEAAHLLRRAGFSARPETIESVASLGREGAVDRLLFFESIPQPLLPSPFSEDDVLLLERRLADPRTSADERTVTEDLLRKVNQRHIDLLRSWWMTRMVRTPRPLEEKMTLLWHGHFTSGFREVQSSRLLWEQNSFLRANAVGSFRTLLRGISRDGAMLRYLDNQLNVKRNPNENYARELMELFTLGEGRYSEEDIREAARAFTGWGCDLEGFRVDASDHDRSTKTIFGARGRFNGDEVIELLLRHPGSSRHMARKLWEFFAHRDPDVQLVERFAQVLRETRFDIRLALRAIFLSDEFYSARAMFSQIKSPVSLVVGAVRLLGIKDFRPDGLYENARLAGQDLFQPPNVKGWDGDRKWITSSTLLSRYEYVHRLVMGPAPRGVDARYGRGPAVVTKRPYDPRPELEEHGLDRPEAIALHYVRLLLQRDLPPDRFFVILGVLTSGKTGSSTSTEEGLDAVRRMIVAIMTLPEFQLE
jgi:uncharacterized protein (DUF1800 family)